MSDLQSDIDALVEEFDLFDDWEERYRYLIDLGRALPALNDDEQVEANKVKGCASQVWMIIEDDDDHLILRGDSDAHIVKGLIALLIRLYSGRTAQDAMTINPKDVLERIGLADNLSPQRSNGLAAMITRIRQEASARLS